MSVSYTAPITDVCGFGSSPTFAFGELWCCPLSSFFVNHLCLVGHVEFVVRKTIRRTTRRRERARSMQIFSRRERVW